MSETQQAESFSFETEVQKLLELMIHSLYSHKEIFLRELISNASDALDRLRFEALTRPDLVEAESELAIRIEADSEARRLTISDNGIGMSRDDLIAHIGTIAKSGTGELAAKMKAAQEAGGTGDLGDLIGQFGVGFYSSFMVAERVELTTRRAGSSEAWLWESAGRGEYRISPAERESQGTSVTLHLKEVDPEQGIEDFCDEAVTTRIVKRYSDFITYPIRLGEAEASVNSMKPIWERSAGETTEEEVNEFYRHISHDWNEPLDVIRQRAEGRIEYRSLLFLPRQAPLDLFLAGPEAGAGLRLYVKRVQIMERCEELLPRYLRFVKGVVDSPDLSLNVSREMLQHDRQIRQIRKALVKKLLDRLSELKEKENDKYLTFWGEFGRVLKEGVSEDPDNRERLLALMLFASSRGEELTGLADYLSRMAEDQKDIYYLTGESREMMESSPHLEAFREKGIEVLLLSDPVDEILVQTTEEYQGAKLKSVAKGELDLGDAEETSEKRKKLEEKRAEWQSFIEAIQEGLGERVKEVRLSSRLTSSPACLVAGEHDFSPRLERLLRESGRDIPGQARVLELNPEHEVLKKLAAKYESDRTTAGVDDYAELLYGYALLAEGSELPDPTGFANRLAELMSHSLD